MVKIIKLTDRSIVTDILKFITGRDKINLSLDQLYNCEHSPIYTQWFIIYLQKIPSYVSVHLRTHEKNGCQHFVGSNRSDKTGVNDELITRMTPVNHVILANAKHLIDISRKRLCYKTDYRTRELWTNVCLHIHEVDSELYPYLVPDCKYRGKCHELNPCYQKN